MKIDLSTVEVKLIDRALRVWESEASTSALMEAMIAMLLCPPDQKAKEKARIDAEMKTAAAEGEHRRRTTTLLRAKMYQAQAQNSEHEVESKDLTPNRI